MVLKERLYTVEKQVFVFKPKTDTELSVQILSVDDTLDGGDMLPDFKLPVHDIFPD